MKWPGFVNLFGAWFLLALIPLGLGMLVFVPVLLISWLLSYQEIFAD